MVIFLIRKKLISLTNITGFIFLFSLILPWYYISENNRIYNYNGITTVSDLNLFAKIVQSRLNVTDITIKNQYDYTLRDCILNSKETDVQVVADQCYFALGLSPDPDFVKSAKIMGDFARRTIINQPKEYILHSFILFPRVISSTEPDPLNWVSTYAGDRNLQSFWENLHKMYSYLQFMFLTIFIFYPLSLILFLKKSSNDNTILVILGTIAFIVPFLNTFFAQSDYSRLNVPVTVPLWLFCGYYILWIIRWIKSFNHHSKDT